MNFINNLLKKEKFKDLIIIIFLFLLPIVFFWRVVFLKQVFFGGDFTFQFLGPRVYIAKLLRQGIFPLWSHDLLTGVPLFALADNAILHPLNLLIVFLPNYLVVHYAIIFSLFLASLFMYIFLRGIKLDRFSAGYGAIIYIVGLFSLCFIVTDFYVLLLLPLTFYFIEIIAKWNKFHISLLGGIPICLQILAGNPQIAFGNFLCIAAFILFRSFYAKNKILFLRNIFLMILIGFLLSSIQLLPTFELTKLSARTVHTYQDMTTGSVSLLQFLSSSNSVFILPFLPILIIAMFRRDNYTKFFLFLIILSIALAMGKYNPINRLFFYLPIIKYFRDPWRYLYMCHLPVTGLCALVINFLLMIPKGKTLYIYKIVFCILLTIPIYFILFRLIEYKPYNDNLKDFLKAENITDKGILTDATIYEMPDFIKFLKGQDGLFRVANVAESRFPFLNFLLYYDIPSVFTKATLPPKELHQYLSNPKLTKEDANLLNIKYLIFPEYVYIKDWSLKLAFDGKEFKIYENKEYLPRIFVVDNLGYEKIIKRKFVRSKIDIVEFKPTMIKINVVSPNDGFLIFNNTCYPGWHSYVDDEETKMLKLAPFLNAIKIKKGIHKVKFSYAPLTFKIGLLISVLTLFIISVIELIFIKSRRGKGNEKI